MHVEELLGRLSHVKKSGDGWTARCVSHEDKRNSLSVGVGTDGRILLRCHASCQVSAILAALGLEERDLFPPKEPARQIVATYDYADETGALLYQVVRYSPKGFAQRVPDGAGGWVWKLGDTRRVLYKLPDLIGKPKILLCFAPDTEVLTKSGWVRLPDLPQSAAVAQWSQDGSVDFVTPLARQRFAYEGEMVNVKAEWCDLLVTPDHRMIAKAQRGRWRTRTASALRPSMLLPVAGAYFPATVPNAPTAEEARLLAAYFGDGRKERGRRRTWNAKKTRKILRLASLLTNLGIPFRQIPIRSAPGWTQTITYAPSVLETFAPMREMSWAMLDWPYPARAAFLDELRFWDGDSTGKTGQRFFTSKQREAEIVSAMAAVTNAGCIVRRDERPHRKNYQTQFVLNLNSRIERGFLKMPHRQFFKGEVFCLTVPSSYLIVRRNGKTVVAGNCEGEKDAEAAWKIGIPATTNARGASEWRADYADQLKAAGVSQIVVIPDNDEPGYQHAAVVCQALRSAGLQSAVLPLPGLPQKGDLSDYLSQHSKAEFVALTKTVAWDGPIPTWGVPASRTFKDLGERRYELMVNPEGIRLAVDHLRRQHGELVGELQVGLLNGHFPHAKTVEGFLSVGDFNFSAVRSRSERAKLLKERAGSEAADVDWLGLLDEFCLRLIGAERRGFTAMVLDDIPDEPEEERDAWEFFGIPILKRHPTILYGLGGSAKSYLALYIAWKLSKGFPVVYLDWEFSGYDHKTRRRALFPDDPTRNANFHYLKCERPIADIADDLRRFVLANGIQFAILDSIGAAASGGSVFTKDFDPGTEYHRHVRRLGIGTLHIAHPPKSITNEKEASVYGSAFFSNLARSIWYVQAAQANSRNEKVIGLYHQKCNLGPKLEPIGLRFRFENRRTTIDTVDVKSVEELAAGLPALDRMKLLLATRELTKGEICDYLDLKIGTVKKILSTHKSVFLKVPGGKKDLWTLAAAGEESI